MQCLVANFLVAKCLGFKLFYLVLGKFLFVGLLKRNRDDDEGSYFFLYDCSHINEGEDKAN